MGNWLYNYQTLFVGMFGFAGVMGTLLFNARLQRAQHKRDIQKSYRERIDARDEAASALRSALYQELKILAATMRREIIGMERAEQVGSENFWVSLLPGTDAYDVFLAKIDLLTSYEIQRTMVAYLSRKEYIEQLTQMSENPEYSAESPFKFHAKREAFPIIRENSNHVILKLESAKSALAEHIEVLPDED